MSLTTIGFLGIFIIFLAFAFIRGPVYGLLAYLWVFCNFPPERWWGTELPDLRWSLIAAVITLFATILKKSRSTRQPWYANWGLRILLLFTVWMWVQSLWALDALGILMISSMRPA